MTLTLVLLWSVELALVFWGWGAWSQWLFGKTCLASRVQGFWGLATAGLFAIACNIFWPITSDAVLVFHACGIFMAAATLVKIRASRREFLLAGAMAPVLAAISLGSDWHYDAGLYHLQTILWFTDFAQSPGIADLHLRLGVNSLWHATSVWATPPPLGLAGTRLVNAVAAAFFLAGSLGFVLDEKRLSPKLVFLVFLAMVGGGVLAGPFGLGSPSTDLPAALFTVFGLGLGFQAYFRKDKALWEQGVALVMLSALIKVAQGLALAPMLVLGWYAGIRRIPWRVLAVVAVMVGFWCARSLAISGCLLFPAQATCLFGTVDPADVGHIADQVKAWARHPGAEYMNYVTGFAWLGKWTVEKAGFLAGISGILLMALVGLAVHPNRKENSIVLAGLLATWLGWFYLAPEPRFGWGFFLAVAEFSFWTLGQGRLMRSDSQVRYWGGFALLAIALLHSIQVRRLSEAQVWLAVPSAGYREVVSPDFDLPVKLTREKEDQCWALPPPCTPYQKRLDALTIQRDGYRLIVRRNQ